MLDLTPGLKQIRHSSWWEPAPTAALSPIDQAYKRMALQIIIQAVVDTAEGEHTQRVEAREWLISTGLEWLDYLGLLEIEGYIRFWHAHNCAPRFVHAQIKYYLHEELCKSIRLD